MITGIILIGVMLMGAVAGYALNRHEWNGGICRKNGLPWEYFDTDSDGARGYQAGDRTCWIGWPVDSPNSKAETGPHS